MMRQQEPKRFPGKVKEQLLTLCAPEQLETLARQTRFIQRAHRRLTGTDFFTLQGSGGSASCAMVKIDGMDALLRHQLHDRTVTDGRAADQGHAATIVALLQTGDLVIRD